MKPEFENDFEEIYRGYSFSYKVTNLMTGFSYKFRVKAVNKEGEGEVSMSTSSIFTAILPSQPFDLTLKSRSNTHIQISWSSPASSGGLPLTGFKVFWALNSTEYTQIITGNELNSAIKEFTDTSVSAGDIHSYRIVATNNLYESLLSDPIRIIASNLPQRPMNPPTVSTVTATSATITVDPLLPIQNGGSSITGYIIQIDNMD